MLTGKFIGKDEFGNKYYINNRGKRWVIYKNNIESTKIPPEWHSWIHFLVKNPPPENMKKFAWQKTHEENLTGTKKAHKPDGLLSSESNKNNKKYENWKI